MKDSTLLLFITSSGKAFHTVGRAVARGIKLGGAGPQFADWWAWLLSVACLSHAHALLVEGLKFLPTSGVAQVPASRGGGVIRERRKPKSGSGGLPPENCRRHFSPSYPEPFQHLRTERLSSMNSSTNVI